MTFVILFVAGLWAGVQNALAGGGSFITLPALIFAGLSPFAANITSTVALFPGQITSGLAGRSLVSGIGSVSFKHLFAVSILGGIVGALLLLYTPEKVFARLVPWLVLAATLIFIWGNFIRKKPVDGAPHALGPVGVMIGQFIIAIYGGYFGGGIGILMMAALTMAGMPTRNAGATKNVLAGVMNASAVAFFVFSPAVQWQSAVVLGIGAIIGGLAGAWALKRVNETALKIAVALIGFALSVGLFLRPVG